MIVLAKNSRPAMGLLSVVALILTLAYSSTPVLGYEVTEEKAQAAKAEKIRTELDPLFDQLKGLESTLSQANVVTKAASGPELANAGSDRTKEEAKPAPVSVSVPESRPSTGAWASVVPVKDSSERVGEFSGEKSSGPANGNGMVSQPSTSTLSLSDMGNAKNVLSTLEGMTSKRNSLDKSMGTMNGVLAQARNLGAGNAAKDKPADKPEPSGSKLDPDNNSAKSKFGDTNDLTMKNISKNNQDAEKQESIKEMMEKALANKDKDKEKEEEKKKAEKQQLEKKLGELVERDPFKFEDYEALRDLFNEKGELAQEVLAQNPKLKEIKEKIVDEFAPRDAAPSKKKEPLLNFLSDKDAGEKFQSPINVDPTSPRVPAHPGH